MFGTNNHSVGAYVKDSAGDIWFAVVRDDKGSRLSDVVFYKDIRCNPDDVGTPAAGQLVPVSGGGGVGGSVPADVATNTVLNNLLSKKQLGKFTGQITGDGVFPLGNSTVVIQNTGGTPVTVDGITITSGNTMVYDGHGELLPDIVVVINGGIANYIIHHLPNKGGDYVPN